MWLDQNKGCVAGKVEGVTDSKKLEPKEIGVT